MFPHHGRVPDTARAVRRHEQKQGSVCPTHALLQRPSQPPVQQNGRCPYTSKWLWWDTLSACLTPPTKAVFRSTQYPKGSLVCPLQDGIIDVPSPRGRGFALFDGRARKCNMQFIRSFLTQTKAITLLVFLCMLVYALSWQPGNVTVVRSW